MLAFMSDVPARMGIPPWQFRLVLGTTQIDFDPTKEEANRRKHRYSLESAVHLLERVVFPFGDSAPFATSDGFMEGGEVRHMHLGVDDAGHVVHMVTTMRSPETVRVISFRRASREERERFETETGYRRDEG